MFPAINMASTSLSRATRAKLHKTQNKNGRATFQWGARLLAQIESRWFLTDRCIDQQRKVERRDTLVERVLLFSCPKASMEKCDSLKCKLTSSSPVQLKVLHFPLFL